MKKILLIAFLLLIGCKSSKVILQYDVNRFVYVRDDRTNLCFATYYLGDDYGAFTNVPCTEEVEREIKIQHTCTK
jgi:hypothetical protein